MVGTIFFVYTSTLLQLYSSQFCRIYWSKIFQFLPQDDHHLDSHGGPGPSIPTRHGSSPTDRASTAPRPCGWNALRRCPFHRLGGLAPQGFGVKMARENAMFFLDYHWSSCFFLLLTVNQSDVDSLYDIRWQVILGSGQWFSELRCWIDSLLSSFRGDMCLYNYMICNLDILVPCLFYTSGYQPTMTGCGCGSRTVSPRN